MKKLTYNVMDYQEFDRLVNDNIPSANGTYEFVAYEELPNDIAKTYVAKVDYMTDFDVSDIESGKLMYRAGGILCYLVWKGIIEAGDYLITVCW